MTETCVLCGLVGPKVSMGLIAWQKPVGRDRFTAAPRCRDVGECKERVAVAGDEWEVRDPEPRSVLDLIRELAR